MRFADVEIGRDYSLQTFVFLFGEATSHLRTVRAVRKSGKLILLERDGRRSWAFASVEEPLAE